HLMVRVFGLENLKFFRWATVCQRTTGFQVGQYYFFIRIQDFGGFSHKMHTRKDNKVGMGRSCFFRKLKTVAYEICYFLYGYLLIIMCQYYSVLFVSELVNRCFEF